MLTEDMLMYELGIKSHETPNMIRLYSIQYMLICWNCDWDCITYLNNLTPFTLTNSAGAVETTDPQSSQPPTSEPPQSGTAADHHMYNILGLNYLRDHFQWLSFRVLGTTGTVL